MKKIKRLIQDAYSGIRNFTGFPVEFCNGSSYHNKILSRNILCVSTQEKLDNSLESSIYHNIASETFVRNHEATIYQLHEVFLTGDRAHPFLEKSLLFNECPGVQRENLSKIRIPLTIGAKNLKGRYFHLTGRNHENRGHFLLQHMPRLLAARDFLNNNKDIKILIAPGHSWQRDYLTTFGFTADRVVDVSAGTILCEELFYVPLFFGSNALCEGKWYRILRDHLYTYYKIDPKPTYNLFVSRRGADIRELENENEIINILEKYVGPITVVDFKKLTLKDRVTLFANAKYVFGPQGQGLTKLLFCSPEVTAVILDYGECRDDWSVGYRDLAQHMGGKSLRLFSGTPQIKNKWIFPPGQFTKMLNKSGIGKSI